MKETSTGVCLGARAWTEFRLQAFPPCVVYQSLEQPHWQGMMADIQWHSICKSLFARKNAVENLQPVFLHAWLASRQACQRWDKIRTVTHQAFHSRGCNKEVCQSQGSQEPRDLQESAPQPGGFLLPITPTDAGPAGLIKAQREE